MRYRDRDGDVWESYDNGEVRLVEPAPSRPGSAIGAWYSSVEVLRSAYGPLTELDTPAPVATPKATFTERVVTTTVAEITLKLTPAEAGTLLAILRRGVTGSDAGPRGHCDSVGEALKKLESVAGVHAAFAEAVRLAQPRGFSNWGIYFGEDGSANG